MTTDDARRYLRTERSPLDAVTLSPAQLWPDLASAYRAVRAVVDAVPELGAAWKLGGTTPATRRVFAVDELYFGALHADELRVEPTAAPGMALLQQQGEVEIALRIADPDPEAEAAFDAWCVAVEMPATPITNLAEVGVRALVADRCAAGCLVLGRPEPMSTIPEATGRELAIELVQEGAIIAEGETGTLVEPPSECARDFLRLAQRLDFHPAAGQWIATGGLTPCVPLVSGCRVEVRLDGEVALAFDVEARDARTPR